MRQQTPHQLSITVKRYDSYRSCLILSVFIWLVEKKKKKLVCLSHTHTAIQLINYTSWDRASLFEVPPLSCDWINQYLTSLFPHWPISGFNTHRNCDIIRRLLMTCIIATLWLLLLCRKRFVPVWCPRTMSSFIDLKEEQLLVAITIRIFGD